MFKKLFIITAAILCLVVMYVIFFQNSDIFTAKPTELPHIYKGVLYTTLKEIPCKYITYIEYIVGGKTAIPYIIINYQYPDSKWHLGMMSMSKTDYLKIRTKLLSRYNIVEVRNAI